MIHVVKVIYNISGNRLNYYPPTVKAAMVGKTFPWDRVGAAAEAMEREGSVNVMPSAGFDATCVQEENGEVVSVAGRKNIYYAWDPTAKTVVVYGIKEIRETQKWSIQRNENGSESIVFADPVDKCEVLIPSLNYCHIIKHKKNGE